MWKSLQINIQNIKAKTDKSILINCPHNSKYDSFSFWYPAKLINTGNNSYAITLTYADSFLFRLKRYGENCILEENEIGSNEFEEIFNVMSGNIVKPLIETESYLYVNEPERIEVNKIEVPKCLQNNKN